MAKTSDVANGKIKRPFNVFVTGFMPYNRMEVNSSWEAVKLLEKSFEWPMKCRDEEVHLKTKEVEVSFEVLILEYPKFLYAADPSLIVHVSMIKDGKVIKLEKYARNTFYYTPDNRFRLPVDSTCKHGAKDILECSLDLEKIRRQVLLKQANIKIDLSYHAGEFVGDFIFYTSMFINKAPVLLVHVPFVDGPFSMLQLAEALRHMIEAVSFDLLPEKKPGLIDISCLKNLTLADKKPEKDIKEDSKN